MRRFGREGEKLRGGGSRGTEFGKFPSHLPSSTVSNHIMSASPHYRPHALIITNNRHSSQCAPAAAAAAAAADDDDDDGDDVIGCCR